MRRGLAALALCVASGVAIAEDAAEEWASAKGSAAESQLHKQLRTIPGTDTQYFLGAYVQLDAIATRKKQDGDEQNTFLVSTTPFGAADRDARLSVRQSQLNGLSRTPTAVGEVWTRLEVNLFPLDGKTRPTLNQLYAQLGDSLLAGKTYSTFMDESALPTTLDYSGPTGVTFVRQWQLRGSYALAEGWTLAGAVEQSQANLEADTAVASVKTSASRPDLAARLRYESERGHLQLSVLSRRLRVNLTTPTASVEQRADGAGVSLSGSLPAFGEDTVLFQVLTGKGIGRYFNDPLSATGLALGQDGGVEIVRISGATLYYQRVWAPDWMTVAGASALWVGNEGLRPPEALQRAVYTSVNLIHRLTPRAIVGTEVLWGEATRVNGTSAANTRVQISFRYLIF